MPEVGISTMSIVATVTDGEKKVSQSRYEAGFLVESSVSRPYLKAEVKMVIDDGTVRSLSGKWPEVLDEYFNRWSFRTDSRLSPNEIARCGCANEHRSLFLTAVRLLEKSLKAAGYKVQVDFT